MPSFRRLIRQAYREILEREPDPQGQSDFNRLMNASMSEAQMRETLLRSPEYAGKNPLNRFADRVGLNVHIPSNAILDDVATGLGARWIRIDFDWFRIEPSRGDFRWNEWDRLVDHASSLGLEMMATLAYTPAWASSNPGNPKFGDPPASSSDWTRFARRAVDRFGEHIRYWQLWNEPNLSEFWNGTRAQFRSIVVEPGARVVRESLASTRIVGPGLANLGNWRDWFEDLMQSRSVFDVISHHNYASNGRDAILELRADGLFSDSLMTLMRRHGVHDRPFWLTETGRRSSAGNQRQYYNDVLLTMRQQVWVDRVFFFHYWDGPAQGDDGFGIVRENQTPKPAYHTLRGVLMSDDSANSPLPRS